MGDRLDVLVGKESCPVCGSISQKGTARCLVRHSIQEYTSKKKPPPPEERVVNRNLDPTASMNLMLLANEEFEGDDSSVKNWKGGSTDFSFIDEEAPLSKVV